MKYLNKNFEKEEKRETEQKNFLKNNNKKKEIYQIIF